MAEDGCRLLEGEDKVMKIGFVGLGKMGRRMVTKLFYDQHDIVVWNRSRAASDELAQECARLAMGTSAVGRVSAAASLADLVHGLPGPRVIWMMLPAGEPTGSVLAIIAELLAAGDILVDGGNAHYKDTEQRFRLLTERKIRFLGIGVSGGIIAERQGYPLMVGGDRSAYDHIVPVLESLASPSGGHHYFGTGGAGHFVKMVHNGIEYGIMQSLGEGFEVLEKAPYKLDLADVARLYQRGTLVSGFMLDRVVEVLERNPTLAGMRGVIAESGEAQWMIDQASAEAVAVDIINSSLEYRRRSQTDTKIQDTYTAKMVAALRNAFGGHDVQTQ
jgi:6-phosphogluconate dehydrogenase